MKMRLLALAALLTCAFMAPPASRAQGTIHGGLVGQVTDEAGAAVPGATVTARNINTGGTREVVTNEEGLYRFTAMPIGTYSVAVTKSGFGTSTIERVEVNAGVDSTANVRLGAAALREEVNVVAEGALLEAQTGQVTKVVDQRRVLELPQSFSTNNLALLNPGVLPNNNSRPGSGFAVNGNRTRSNNFTLDGANNNDQSLQIPRQSLPHGAIAEYQVITNTFAAEFGRNAGSYVNIITRSGTNEFHGIGFWEWAGNGVDSLTTAQQRCLNANRADPRGRSEQQILRGCRAVEVSNSYGFSMGGPIVRNHTFFFGNADYNDFRTTVSAPSTVRTALSPAAVALLQANASLFAPGHLNYLLSNFPVANDPTSQGTLELRNLNITCPSNNASCNVIGTAPLQRYNRFLSRGIPYGRDFDRYMGKINTRINRNDQLSVRYLYDKSIDPGAPANIEGQEIGQNITNHSLTVNDVYVINSRWVNEARVTYAKRDATFPENLGIQFGITGFGTIGNQNFPQFRNDTMWEFTDNVAYTSGNHAMKFGYNLLRYNLNSFFAPASRGVVSYGDINSFLFDRNASFSQFAGSGLTSAITYENSWFAQDDWRVTPDLTLNLGLRYEYVTAPFGFFSEAKPDINNFGPRIGFAWNPKNWFDGRAVLRGGFAVSYDQIFQNILLNNSRNYPRGVTVSLTNVSGQSLFLNPPTPPTPDQFTGNPLLLPVRLFAPGERIKQPQSRQWTLGVQYQLGRDYVVKAEYIGTQGRNLVREVEVNYGFCGALSQFNTPCNANAATLNRERLDPTRGSILVSQGQANSIYHSGQFTFEKRFSEARLFGVGFGDVLFNANYTWSAFISESDDILGGQANRTLPADPRNPKLDRARSGFDQPHRFVASYIWNTPDVFRDNGLLNRIFGGWQISGITTLADGTPFSVLSANNALGILPGQISTVELSQRVSVNPQGQYPLVTTPTRPVANAYFIVHAAGSGILGNLGANTERTGGTIRTDAALAKNIRTFGENQRLQFRMDIFNLFNRRNFTVIPSNTVGNTPNPDVFLNFGQTNVTGRQFTFGARYYF